MSEEVTLRLLTTDTALITGSPSERRLADVCQLMTPIRAGDVLLVGVVWYVSRWCLLKSQKYDNLFDVGVLYCLRNSIPVSALFFYIVPCRCLYNVKINQKTTRKMKQFRRVLKHQKRRVIEIYIVREYSFIFMSQSFQLFKTFIACTWSFSQPWLSCIEQIQLSNF